MLDMNLNFKALNNNINRLLSCKCFGGPLGSLLMVQYVYCEFQNNPFKGTVSQEIYVTKPWFDLNLKVRFTWYRFYTCLKHHHFLSVPLLDEKPIFGLRSPQHTFLVTLFL